MRDLSPRAERILLHITGITCCGSSKPSIQREPGWRDSGLFGAHDQPVADELVGAGLITQAADANDHGERYVRATAGIEWARAWQERRRTAAKLRRYAVAYVEKDGTRYEMPGGFYRSRGAARYAAALDVSDYDPRPIFEHMRRLRVTLDEQPAEVSP